MKISEEKAEYAEDFVEDYENITSKLENLIEETNVDWLKKEIHETLSDFYTQHHEEYEEQLEICNKIANDEKAYLNSEYERTQL